MQEADAIIVGGGPCGLAARIALQNIGLQPIVIEKEISSMPSIITLHIKHF